VAGAGAVSLVVLYLRLQGGTQLWQQGTWVGKGSASGIKRPLRLACCVQTEAESPNKAVPVLKLTAAWYVQTRARTQPHRGAIASSMTKLPHAQQNLTGAKASSMTMLPPHTPA
jgi:hypothetical protein